jgi:hypothetical protein
MAGVFAEMDRAKARNIVWQVVRRVEQSGTDKGLAAPFANAIRRFPDG